MFVKRNENNTRRGDQGQVELDSGRQYRPRLTLLPRGGVYGGVDRRIFGAMCRQRDRDARGT
jgi:hypothetical protein